MDNNPVHHAYITCPVCGFRQEVEMPADACLFFHRCANCNIRLRPAAGDCCVICSYSDRLCLLRQREQAAGQIEGKQS